MALTLAAALPAMAQQAAVVNPARITQAVDDSVLTTLRGNTHPLARPEFDKGPVNASLAADRMLLVLKRSEGQEIALRQFLGSLQDPNSSQYRKWLTPEQFGTTFGVSEADIQTVNAWLASQGFKVSKVNKARTVIEFSGSIGQIQTAFHTQIHNFTVNGEQHLANVSDPRIPTALTPVVAGLSSLNNFFPKPPHLTPKLARYDKATGKFSSDLTVGSASQGYLLALGPGDAATIYNTPNSFNVNFNGSTSNTGNALIGIAGISDIAPSDIANYRALFGLGLNIPSVVVDGNDPGAIGGDAELEAVLDLEVSAALAPGAVAGLYVSADTNLDSGLALAISRAVDDNSVSILSVSFGECELGLESGGNQLFYFLWEQAAAQGISVIVSAGDNGSAGCDDFNTSEAAQYGLQVSGFASTPFNIAVGGTDYDVLATDFTKYVSTTNSSNYTSALGYIPEEPWNNSTSTNGLLSANIPYKDSMGDTNIAAGSGGASGCVAPEFDSNGNFLDCGPAYTTGSLTGWAKPSWQTGGNLNIPADGVRDLLDVSLLAGDGLYSAAWLVCANLASTDNTCVPGADGFTFYPVGGTSAAAPAFAGMLALVIQSLHTDPFAPAVRLGQANYVLYNLANQTSLYNTIFHDTTAGNNSVYCVSGSPNCGSNLFETGYNVGTGYDEASGLGSVDVTQLIDNWTKATLTPANMSFTINGGTAPVSITHGQSVTLNASIEGTGFTPSPTPTPTGEVAIVSNANQQLSANETYNSNSLAVYTLINGATGSQTYSNLPGGTYTVSAYYGGGDITYTQSQSGQIQVTVARENSVLNLFALAGVQSATNTPVMISGSYPYGTAFSLDAQPIGVSQQNAPAGTVLAPATGTVTFSDTGATLPRSPAGAVPINSLGVAELPVYYWSTAAHSVRASYAGDNSFNAGASTIPVAFTISQAPTASTVSSSASTVSGGTFTVTSLITPTPASGATPPTGTVALTIGGGTIGSGAVTATQDPNTGASLATVTMTVNASSLASGANTITAAYSGDTNYAASSGTVSVTSTATPPGLTISGTAISQIAVGSSGTSTVTVTPSGGFTGAVNLTCSVSGPSGATSPATCSYNPASVTISGTTAATSVLTVATISTTTAGTYPVTLNGADAATGKVTASSTLTVTVGSATFSGNFAIAATAVSIASAGSSGTSTITVTPAAGSAGMGTLNLTCTLTTSPSGATAPPTCSLSASSVTLNGTTAPAPVTGSIATTAPTSGALAYPQTNRNHRWYTAAGGAALACVLFFGIPARRRGWRSMFALLVFLVTMAGVGCGGGGGNNNTPMGGTTAGKYTFTVTGTTGSSNLAVTASTSLTVTVQWSTANPPSNKGRIPTGCGPCYFYPTLRSFP